ncbi:MAG: hypothetical protein HY291_14880 [Planctomycetes bacterium]|nr:hypothetical protein [Planctomycetota bacterium]
MRTASMNKEKTVFLLALAVLLAALFTFVQHQVIRLAENDPLPRVAPPALHAKASTDAPSRQSVASRASPFMPPKAIVLPDNPPRHDVSVPPPNPPPQLPPKVEPRPQPTAPPPAFSFMGIVINDARACALVRKPDGTPLRVYKGDPLPDSDLKVKDIRKQSIELVDLEGRTVELTDVGLR